MDIDAADREGPNAGTLFDNVEYATDKWGCQVAEYESTSDGP